MGPIGKGPPTSSSHRMNWRASHRRFPWLAYVLAVGMTMATLRVRLALGYSAGDMPMMILFVLPVMLSAYAGGLGPGLVATVTGALVADYFLMPPLHSLAIKGANGVQWVAFIAVGVAVSVLLEKTRSSAMVDASELARERAILKAILDSVPALIFSKDREHRFVRVNQEMAAAVGRTREAIEGRTDVELGSPHAERFHRDEDEIFATGVPKRNLIELLTTKEGDRWLQTEKIPQLDSDGRIVGIVGFAVDITERLRAEAAAAREKLFSDTMIDSMSGILYFFNEQGKYLRWNRALERVSGYSTEEVARMHPLNFFRSEDAPLLTERIAEVFAQGESSVEAPFLAKDGSVKPYFFTGKRVLFDGATCLVGIGLDISERKRAEERLRESEERLQAVTENLSEGLIVSDLTGQLLHWNRAGLEMHGYRSIEDGLHEMPHFARTFELSFLDGGKMALEQWPLPRVLQGEKLRDLEVRIRRLDSDWERVFSYSGSIVHDVHGKPLAYLAINDITERQKAEIARREAEARIQQFNAELERRVVDRTEQLEAANVELRDSRAELNSVFESLPGLYLVLTRDFQIVAVSDAFLKATMTTREGLVGRDFFEVFPDNPDDREAGWAASLGASFDRVIENSAPDTMAIQKHDIRRPDGRFEERYWSPINSPVFGADRRIQYIVHRVEEVTEFMRQKSRTTGSRAEFSARVQQMEAEIFQNSQKLRAANLQLEGANKELESFSYSVSHDLRAPLRAIAGFSQALDESSGQRLDETERGYLARVRAAAERMGHLIDDLLDLSRVSRSEMTRRPVDLSGLARTIVEELRGRTPARVVQIEIEEGLSIEGDPRLLRTMLENLLGNAWKFTGQKESAHIAFRCAKSEPSSVTFVIADDGAGFDMRYSGKLFGAFQRLHALTEFPGTGIGLATVQRIIHRHGGRIWAESVAGAGAVFSFELPISNLNKTN